MTVYEDFYAWITGIEEDDPLPHEINYVYFAVSFKNDICSLCYGGTENYESHQIDFEYFPLEAQFFYNESFNQIAEIETALLTLKNLLDDCFKKSSFKQIFKGKTVIICEFGGENVFYNH